MGDMSHGSNQGDGVFSGINVTPLTDVMLVLLITFLLSASTFESDSLSVPLPQVKATADIEKHAVLLQVSKDGLALWPDPQWAQLSREEALTRLLQQHISTPTLAIAVDRDCSYERFYPLAAAAARAGWQRLLLVTEEASHDKA